MADIVCAVRGGPGSYHTRLAGLRHAAERDVAVHFLSVVDPMSYAPLHAGEQNAIRAEMARRDLAMARATASRAGLNEVRFTVAVKVGPLVETVADYAREMSAASILIGNPRSATDAAFAADGAEQFAESLRDRAGVPVVVVPGAPYSAPSL